MFYWVHSGREKREHRWSWFRCLGCHLSACDVWGRSAPCIFICKSRNIRPICYMKIEALQWDSICKCPTRRIGAFPIFLFYFFFFTFHGMFLNPAWIDDPSLPSLPQKYRAENYHCYSWQIHAPFSCISDNTLQTEPYFQRRQQSLAGDPWNFPASSRLLHWRPVRTPAGSNWWPFSWFFQEIRSWHQGEMLRRKYHTRMPELGDKCPGSGHQVARGALVRSPHCQRLSRNNHLFSTYCVPGTYPFHQFFSINMIIFRVETVGSFISWGGKQPRFPKEVNFHRGPLIAGGEWICGHWNPALVTSKCELIPLSGPDLVSSSRKHGSSMISRVLCGSDRKV